MSETTVPMPTVAVPSFVTVTLAPTDPTGGPADARTMRVPIAATTTVRELAKAAMKRYMLSLRRRSLKGEDGAVRQLCRSGIAVTDVFLLFSADAGRPNSGDAGTSTAPSQQVIELFSDDCVVQVVQVMKETVHMRFRGADAVAAAAGAGAATGTTEGKADTAAPPASPPPQAVASPARVCSAARASCVIDVEETSNTVGSSVPSPASLSAAAPDVKTAAVLAKTDSGDDDGDEHGACAVAACAISAPSTAKASRTSSALEAKASAAETVVSSRSVSAENSCSNVVPITTSKRRIEPDPTSHRARSKNRSSVACDIDSDSDADDRSRRSRSTTSNSSDDSTAEREKIAQSIATLRQRETQRMRWGPDAHKHFAANYVSSPHKIMKGRYKCAGGPPPSVQLHHPTSTSSACSSQGSVSRAQSPRTLLSDTTREAPSSARLATTPPPPTQPRKRASIDEEVKVKPAPAAEAAPQCRPEPSLKVHCGEVRPLASCAATIAARSALPIPASPSEASLEKARRPLMLPSATRPPVTAALCTTQPMQPQLQQTSTPALPPPPRPLASTVVDEASARTPVSGAVRADASPAVPGTVAKPVVGVVARQLRFEEEGDTASKVGRGLSLPPDAITAYRA